MKSMKRVVVTGMGAITPIGNSVEEFWNGIKEQKIGFAPITYFDATEYNWCICWMWSWKSSDDRNNNKNIR